MLRLLVISRNGRNTVQNKIRARFKGGRARAQADKAQKATGPEQAGITRLMRGATAIAYCKQSSQMTRGSQVHTFCSGSNASRRAGDVSSLVANMSYGSRP